MSAAFKGELFDLRSGIEQPGTFHLRVLEITCTFYSRHLILQGEFPFEFVPPLNVWQRIFARCVGGSWAASFFKTIHVFLLSFISSVKLYV